MTRLRTGQVAQRAGVNVETLRFYERKGLLEAPPRRASGFREYPEEVVVRIRFIKRAQQLGFSLREILELLKLAVDGETVCAEVRTRTEKKIADIEERIAGLRRMHAVLRELTEACAAGTPTGECPILASLEEEAAAGAPSPPAGRPSVSSRGGRA